MPDAPLATEQWLRITRALALGSTGMMLLFAIVGLVVYAFLCRRSRRQWDGLDQRWTLHRR